MLCFIYISKTSKENRKIFNKYLQILITAEQKKLIERNNKKIYSKIKML